MKRAFGLTCAAVLAASAIALTTFAGNPWSATAAAAKSPTAKAPVISPCSLTSAAARAKCKAFKQSAPGDQYFGKLKLSYLGINNTFKDEAVRSGANTIDPAIISRVNFADNALAAWAKAYPNDPQLARSYYLAVLVFQRIYTQPSQLKAWTYTKLLATRYRTTWFGKQSQKSMTGFIEHWYAVAEPCPTPLPRGARSRPTPSPEPAASPGPNEPIVELIIPPCVPPPPTPGPSPLVVPSATFTFGPPKPLPTKT